MQLFGKVVNEAVNFFVISPILDIWMGSVCVFDDISETMSRLSILFTLSYHHNESLSLGSNFYTG